MVIFPRQAARASHHLVAEEGQQALAG
jgi:hypothetical protein